MVFSIVLCYMLQIERNICHLDWRLLFSYIKHIWMSIYQANIWRTFFPTKPLCGYMYKFLCMCLVVVNVCFQSYRGLYCNRALLGYKVLLFFTFFRSCQNSLFMFLHSIFFFIFTFWNFSSHFILCQQMFISTVGLPKLVGVKCMECVCVSVCVSMCSCASIND